MAPVWITKFLLALHLSVSHPLPPVPTPVQSTVVVTVPYATLIQWGRVAWCEQHDDWTVVGPVYSGSLGISNVNWVSYGGTWFVPNAGEATPAEQIVIAERIEGNGYVPDQDGYCAPW
jgi:hypothetical protein